MLKEPKLLDKQIIWLANNEEAKVLLSLPKGL